MSEERAEEIIGEIEAEYDELCEAIDICYVDKDKIKEKIEELKAEEQKYQCSNIYGFAIEIIEELLNDV